MEKIIADDKCVYVSVCAARGLRGKDKLGRGPSDHVQHISCQGFSFHITQEEMTPDSKLRSRTFTRHRSSASFSAEDKQEREREKLRENGGRL